MYEVRVREGIYICTLSYVRRWKSYWITNLYKMYTFYIKHPVVKDKSNLAWITISSDIPKFRNHVFNYCSSPDRSIEVLASKRTFVRQPQYTDEQYAELLFKDNKAYLLHAGTIRKMIKI